MSSRFSEKKKKGYGTVNGDPLKRYAPEKKIRYGTVRNGTLRYGTVRSGWQIRTPYCKLKLSVQFFSNYKVIRHARQLTKTSYFLTFRRLDLSFQLCSIKNKNLWKTTKFYWNITKSQKVKKERYGICLVPFRTELPTLKYFKYNLKFFFFLILKFSFLFISVMSWDLIFVSKI